MSQHSVLEHMHLIDIAHLQHAGYMLQRQEDLQRSTIPANLELAAGRSSRRFDESMTSLELQPIASGRKMSREIQLRKNRARTLERERLDRLDFDLGEVENVRNRAMKSLEEERSMALLNAKDAKSFASIFANFQRESKHGEIGLAPRLRLGSPKRLP